MGREVRRSVGRLVSFRKSLGGSVRRLILSMPALVLAASCSSSGPATHPAVPSNPNSQIGQVVAPTTPAPDTVAVLGAPITKGALTITVAGPATTKNNDPGLIVTFHVTMTNTSTAGDVAGPASFGIRCDANRADRAGDGWASSTASDKKMAAGQTMTGTADVAWLTWNTFTKCTGPTTIEALFRGGSLSWTLPADVVAKVNAAGA